MPAPRHRPVRTALVAALLAVATTATSAAVASSATAGPAAAGRATIAPRAAAVTPDSLALMVLPRELLAGARFDALQPSSTTGEMDIEDSPRYTLDPRDDAGDVTDAGWLAGYDRSWGPGFAPDGSFFGGSNVQLFDSESSAALYHAQQIEAFRLFRGRLIEGGWTLKSTDAWRVPALGADAWALRNVFRSNAGTFYDTEVHVRVGRVVGEVGIISSRSTDLKRAIETDGKALQLRIKRVAGLK